MTSPGWSRRLSHHQTPRHVCAQRCPHLIHPLPVRLATPDRSIRDNVPDPRLDLEQHRLHDLLDHRSKPSGSCPTYQGDLGDLPDRPIGEHQVRTVEPDQLAELLHEFQGYHTHFRGLAIPRES